MNEGPTEWAQRSANERVDKRMAQWPTRRFYIHSSGVQIRTLCMRWSEVAMKSTWGIGWAGWDIRWESAELCWRYWKALLSGDQGEATLVASRHYKRNCIKWTTSTWDIGCSLKRNSINMKKKCKKKWRCPCRRIQIWYNYNNNAVFIFAKKWFSNYDFFCWYGLLNVKFW